MLACIAVFGCGNDYQLEARDRWVRGGGIMNDSMALLFTGIKEYYYVEGTFGAGGGGKTELRECNLISADIRTEKIYWQKKIPILESCEGLQLFVFDSVLFFFDDYRLNRFTSFSLKDEEFQKAKQVKFKFKEIRSPDNKWFEYVTNRAKIRPWQNKLLVSTEYYSKEYALLDTAAGTFKLWEPSGEFEWLNECSDVKWNRINGLCLKKIPDTLGFVLLKNGVDTLAVRYMPHEVSIYSYGGKPLIFSGNSIISEGWVYFMSEQGHISEKPLDVWVYEMGKFYDLYGNKAYY